MSSQNNPHDDAETETDHHLFLGHDFSSLDHTIATSTIHDEEIALEALRAAISGEHNGGGGDSRDASRGRGRGAAGNANGAATASASDGDIAAAAAVVAAAEHAAGEQSRIATSRRGKENDGSKSGNTVKSSDAIDIDGGEGQVMNIQGQSQGDDEEGEEIGENEDNVEANLEADVDNDADADIDAQGEAAPLDSSAIETSTPHHHNSQPTVLSESQAQIQSINKAVSSLAQLQQASSSFIDSMNLPHVFHGLLGSFKLLVDCNRRQGELIKTLTEMINKTSSTEPSPVGFVSKADYDALKSRYDSLVTTTALSASGISGSVSNLASAGSISGVTSTLGGGVSGAVSTPTVRKSRQRASLAVIPGEDGKDGEGTPFGDDKPGRKRRSIKLEHLVHKMANRRLGVEYTVSSFEVKGTRDLPEPLTQAPTSTDSPNGVDEFRPDFRAEITAASVAPFISAVIEDTKSAWLSDFAPPNGSGGGEEADVDDETIVRAVHTYWLRLGKRWDEQQSRLRGEIHRDELTRKKQNQYRRQQSLVARRIYAFDQSPLNFCRLRALYRTLLTIDFAAPTNEKPDTISGNRTYTEDEWYAYRKAAFGSKEFDAHEVVDLFWLSPTARSVLVLLDTFAADQQARLRRKGRPKAPSPTFHLPPDLWDRSTLPVLRPKDAEGLPIPGAGGIVLFRFHVDPQVQAKFPDWASGLYDNPPIPDEDAHLSNLNETMNAASFVSLKPKVRLAMQKEGAQVVKMDEAQIQAILAAPDAEIVPGPHPLSHFASVGNDENVTEGGDTKVSAVGMLAEAQAAAAAAAAVADVGGSSSNPDDTFDYSADFMSAPFVSLTSSTPLLHPFGPESGTSSGVGGSSFVVPGLTVPSTPGSVGSASTLINLGGVGVVLGGTTTGKDTVTPGSGGGPGSSLRARKQAKRTMSEVPGGAATPVPLNKRRRGVGVVNMEETRNTSSVGENGNGVGIGVGAGGNVGGVSSSKIGAEGLKLSNQDIVEEEDIVELGDDASFFDSL